MINPDTALKKLNDIYTEFGSFCQKRGQVTEADTRAKVIDRILKEVLGWPEDAFGRELPVHQGYIDYLLVSGSRKLLLVEAKREGIPFDIPKTLMTRKKYKISGSIKTNAEIKEAIDQAQRYCVNLPVRYAVVTNGYAWLLFRALREDISWLEGHILVFPAAGYIKEHFIDFWNILNYQAVLSGSLEEEFAPEITTPRMLTRPIDLLANPDAPLFRNKYHMHLHPFVESVFRDIGAKQQIDILEKCYVYSKSLSIIDDDLKMVIEDSIPRFAYGAVETKPGRQDAGPLGEEIKRSAADHEGVIFLLLGGIGSGKTTFLKRFFTYVGKQFIEQHAVWFYIDFKAPPTDKNQLESFLKESILFQLRERYSDLNLESRESLLLAYKDKIEALRAAILDSEKLCPDKYNQRLNSYIEKWMSKTVEYVPRILRLTSSQNKKNILCIDNVDQLPSDYQAKIFLLSQLLAREMEAIVIVALREESFYAASIQKAFTAYNNRMFHIASPPFGSLISHRLSYCRKMLEMPQEDVVIRLGARLGFDREAIAKFLDIVEYSIFSRNRNISRFIEALAFGNMREALDMFATFLYSGVTNVDKMLRIYDRDGQYFVAFHEFAKSVILGDWRYYKDSRSKIINLFDCGADKNSSHFTSIRLLLLLLAHVNESSSEGRGYVNIEKVFASFLDVFDNEKDLNRAVLHLLRKQLIQLDTRSVDTFEGAGYMRISSAGWYYYKYLVRAFAYLDLVFQDTPLNEPELAKKLKNLVIDVDEIADVQAFMPERMELRFERVGAFLDYLLREERKEREKFSLSTLTGIFNQELMPDIQNQYMRERRWIERRIKDKAEKQTDDTLALDENVPNLPDVLEER